MLKMWLRLHECCLCSSSLRAFPMRMRHFEQALRVDRPPPSLCFATPCTLPATQGQRSKDAISLEGVDKAAFRCRAGVLYEAADSVRD